MTQETQNEKIRAEQAGQIKTLRKVLGQRPIVFVGLMGAGKTAIGRRVAQLAQLPFIDSDHEIEAISKMTIPELFENYGEAEFRSLERRVIRRLLKTGPRIISTGGGAFMNETTQARIARRGISVWLKADLDLLMARVSRKQNRPLLQKPNPRAIMAKFIEDRYPVYKNATLTIESDDIGKDEMSWRVIQELILHMENKDR